MKRAITALAVILITALVWFLMIPEKVEINESSEINYAMILDTETEFEMLEEEQINKSNKMNQIITLETGKGEIKFKIFPEAAPNTVENFIKLANEGFYDGTIFHRVIDGFMIQGGDPTGTGRGGPGYTFNDEIDPNSDLYQRGYQKGIIAMANSGPNTQGSQFFIMVSDNPLPPMYTIFGEVISGQDVADAISLVEKDRNNKPLEDIILKKVSISK